MYECVIDYYKCFICNRYTSNHIKKRYMSYGVLCNRCTKKNRFLPYYSYLKHKHKKCYKCIVTWQTKSKCYISNVCLKYHYAASKIQKWYRIKNYKYKIYKLIEYIEMKRMNPNSSYLQSIVATF